MRNTESNIDLDKQSAANENAMLRCEHISLNYGTLKALTDVSLVVNSGEVLGLVGDNGAGKSSLLSVLGGSKRPTKGTVYINGNILEAANPLLARKRGIEVVYQDLALGLTRDVVANIFMGREVARRGILGKVGFLDKTKMTTLAHEALERVGIVLPDLRVHCGQLSGGQRQAIAVARGIAWGARAILLDEPTAALAVTEQRRVSEIIGQAKIQGMAIVLVSHNLPQVLDVADRIAVLRRGQKVLDAKVDGIDVDELVAYITGSKTAET